MMGCRIPRNSITFAPVFSFRFAFLDNCFRESCFPATTSRGLVLHHICFCGCSKSVRKYQLSCSLTFSCGLFRPLNSAELGFEIITNSNTASETFFLKVCVLVNHALKVQKTCMFLDALVLTPKNIRSRRQIRQMIDAMSL